MEHNGHKRRKQRKSVGLAFRFACGQLDNHSCNLIVHALTQITHVSHLLRAANTEVESNVLKSSIKVESSNLADIGYKHTNQTGLFE